MRMLKAFSSADLHLAVFVVFALAGCQADVGWREFRSTEGGFSVMLPGRPEEQSQMTATVFGTIESVVFLVDKGDSGYLTSYADYPPELVQGSPIEVILDGISVGILSQSGGTLVRSLKIQMGEFEGRQLEIISPGEESLLTVRIYLVGNRIYQLSVVAKVGENVSADATLYFESFALLGR